MTSRFLAAPALLALIPALLGLAAPRASAITALPLGPINANFSGNGSVSTGTFGPYDTEYAGTGTPTLDLSGLRFTGDSLTLDYSPIAFQNLAQSNAIIVGQSFTGTDILTAAGGTLILGLAGTYTGPTGSIFSLGGSVLNFTGTATVTGGTLGLTGTAPVTLTETQTVPSAAIPAGGVGSRQQPTGPASFTAVYGRLTPAVPEPSSFALLGLGLVPVGLIARRRRTAR